MAVEDVASATFQPGALKEAFRVDFGTSKYHYYEVYVMQGGTFSGVIYETGTKGGTWVPVFRFRDLHDHLKIGLNGFRYSKLVAESTTGGVLKYYYKGY